MASRAPLVLGPDGLAQQLQSSDTLAGPNVKFTASSALPAVTISAGGTLVLNVSPVVPGNSLATGEAITVQPTAPLPGGLNLAWWLVSATNTVQVGLSSGLAIAAGGTALNWLVTAHR